MHHIAWKKAKQGGQQLPVAISLLAGLLVLTPMTACAESPSQNSPSTDDATVSIRNGIVTTSTDQVMTISDAFRRWNGQGVLLLLPSEPFGTSEFPSAFTIGAVFAKDDPASGDCYPSVGAIRLSGGGTKVELYPEAWTSKENLKIGILETSDAGRNTHTLTNGRCRFTLEATTKTLRESHWQEVLQPYKAVLSEEAVFPDPRTVESMNKLTDSLAARAGAASGSRDHEPKLQSSTFFGELTEKAVRINLTGAYTREEAERCPEVSGTVLFTPEGVRIRAPWPRDNALTPGIVRNVDQRATTLILQNSQCRTELQVTRESNVGGTWARVPLAPIPLALEQPAFRDP